MSDMLDEVSWGELVTEESEAGATCNVCPHFRAWDTGRAGVLRVLEEANEHTKLGTIHSVHIDLEL